MRYKHFIWDFDGMLFNTYPRMAKAFDRVLRELGIEVPADELMEKLKISVRAARAYYVEKYSIDPSFDFAGTYLAYENGQPVETMIPYEGMPEMLRKSHELGAHHHLYSHRNKGAIEGLAYYGLDKLFDSFITSDDNFPGKPAPDAILSLIDRGLIDPKSACMVGDRDIDVLAGINAGIAGCLFDPEHFYDNFETEHRVRTAEELLDWMIGE